MGVRKRRITAENREEWVSFVGEANALQGPRRKELFFNILQECGHTSAIDRLSTPIILQTRTVPFFYIYYCIAR